jgi:hypothetical protein
MKHLLTLIGCCLALSLSAQELTLDYPYNPDYENDGNVGVEDLLQLLAYFDMGFEVDDIVIDEVTLTQWLQTISQTLINQQATIDSLQASLDSQETPLDVVNETVLMAVIPSFVSGTLLDQIIPNQSSYTVPTGKQLFVQFAKTFPNPEPIIIDGQHISCSPTGGSEPGDWKRLIMDENETLSFGVYGSLSLHGTLVDKNSNEDWITIVLDDANNLTYTVPTGKYIFINSVVVSCAYQGNYYGNIAGLEIGNILFQPGNDYSTVNSLNEFDKSTFPENTEITLLTNDNPSMVIIRALLY